MLDIPTPELSGEVTRALEDAQAAFQPHWAHLQGVYAKAIFELLMQECPSVKRVIVRYDGAFNSTDADFYDAEGEEVDLLPSENLSLLLAEAHGYLNFSTCSGEFRA